MTISQYINLPEWAKDAMAACNVWPSSVVVPAQPNAPEAIQPPATAKPDEKAERARARWRKYAAERRAKGKVLRADMGDSPRVPSVDSARTSPSLSSNTEESAHTKEKEGSESARTVHIVRADLPEFGDPSVMGKAVDSSGQTKAFRDFWARWPKGQYSSGPIRNAAWSVWKARCLDPHLPAILDGLDGWIASEQWKSGVCHKPTTWLTDGLWECPPAAKPASKREEGTAW